jgi:hypothetical protein
MPLAFALAAATIAAPPPQPKAAPPVRHAEEGCAFSPDSVLKGEVVVCGKRADTYRLNPDVLEAKRLRRSGGRPKPPDRMADDSCKVVGPMGCRGAGTINLLGAALAAASMADKLSRGQSVASVLATDPQPSEYQLYLEAKAIREAKEEEGEIAQAVKAAKADSTR